MRTLFALALALAAAGAQAQYAAPGARPAPTATRPAAAATAARPVAAAPTGATALAPLCFEPMDPRDTALATALQSNGLLCSTVAKKGDPVRLVAAPNGELSSGPGPATVWHRFR